MTDKTTTSNQGTTTTTSTGSTPAPSTPPTQSLTDALMPILLMIVAFYFLMIRPQQKKEEKKRQRLATLKRGDRVLTLSGIIGTVHKIPSGSNEISLEISEGVRVKILKNAISDIIGSSDLKEESSEEGENGNESKNLDAEAKSGKKAVDKASRLHRRGRKPKSV